MRTGFRDQSLRETVTFEEMITSKDKKNKKNKKKKSWRGLTQGDLKNQEKKTLEGDSHWGTWKNKKKKSWRRLTQGT